MSYEKLQLMHLKYAFPLLILCMEVDIGLWEVLPKEEMKDK